VLFVCARQALFAGGVIDAARRQRDWTKPDFRGSNLKLPLNLNIFIAFVNDCPAPYRRYGLID